MNKPSLPIWKTLFLCFLIFGSIWTLNNHTREPDFQEEKGQIFGTTFHITYQSDRGLKDSILKELEQVDNSLSPFNKRSLLTAINENRTTQTDTLFREVYTMSQRISHETNGAFDITIAPLVNAWGFGFKNSQTVTPEKIDSLLNLIGYKKISLRNRQIYKQDPRMLIDCSAIAKGYGCDQIARLFKRKNINNFMIEIGGEVVVSGVNPHKQAWRIGINRPVEDSLSKGNRLQTILNLSQTAMATSGNYRNFYYKNGKKYAHTINPHTGYPIEHSLLSATVLAPTCAQADAYATAFMVMGLEQSKLFLNKHPELQAYLIYTDQQKNNKVWHTTGLAKSFSPESHNNH